MALEWFFRRKTEQAKDPFEQKFYARKQIP